MPQPQPSQTDWVYLYVSQNHASKTRYEIDLYLLSNGCDPLELEAVWQTLQGKPEKKKRNLPDISKWLPKLPGITVFVLSLVLLFLTFDLLPPFYLTRVANGGLKLFLMLVVLLFWRRQHYFQQVKGRRISGLIDFIPVISIIAGLSLLLSLFFDVGWISAANTRYNGYTYHLLVKGDNCGWEDCKVDFELYKCGGFDPFCSRYAQTSRYQTYVISSASSGDLSLKVDPNTSRLNILIENRLFESFES